MTDLIALPHTDNLEEPLTLEIQPHRPSLLARVMKNTPSKAHLKQKRVDHSVKYSLSRWTDGITDPKIRALYVATLQHIKHLTRGRR
jgi:hypothetical protein